MEIGHGGARKTSASKKCTRRYAQPIGMRPNAQLGRFAGNHELALGHEFVERFANILSFGTFQEFVPRCGPTRQEGLLGFVQLLLVASPEEDPPHRPKEAPVSV